MASKQERVRAAKQRLADAVAERDAHIRKHVEKVSIGEKATALIARLEKRAGMLVFRPKAEAPPEYTPKGVMAYSLGWGTGRERTEKELREGLEAGNLKVELPGGGPAVAASTAVKRTRIPSSLNVRAIQRAQKVVDRAEARLRAAEKALADTVAEAFEAGTMPDPKAFYSAIAQAKVASDKRPYGWAGNDWREQDKYEIERDRRAIEQAEMHLAAARSGAECGCDEDKRLRADQERATAEIERRAQLPRRKIVCPEHGAKFAHWERVERNLQEDRAEQLGFGRKWGVFTLPVGHCPAGKTDGSLFPGHTLILMEQLKADQAAEAKARAKANADAAKAVKAFQRELAARKAAAAKLPPPDEGDEIAFVCPGCDQVNDRAEVMSYGDDGDEDAVLVVGCYRCGSESSVSGVARLSLPAQQEGEKAA